MSVEDRYYNINRVLLKMLGLWPYQNLKWARVQAVFATSIYLSAILAQLAVLITHRCTMDILIDVLSYVFPSICILLMYDTCYFNSDAMKTLMENIYYDWKSMKNKAELDIMDNYGNIIKSFAEVFLFLFCFAMFITIATHATPLLLNVISPLNKSREPELHITVEYFIDSSKYQYVFIFHLTIFVCLAITTALGTGLAYLTYGFHACAMFKVANYRMKIIIDNNVLRIPNPVREHVIQDRIVCAVNVHRRAIQYTNLLMSSLEKTFFFATIIGVISLSINLFRFLKVLSTYNEIIDLVIPFAQISVHFCYLFSGNHVGQQVTNNNAEIFDTVYDLPWYIAPRNIQKLLLFLLQKSHRNVYLTVGRVYNASYESFTTLTKLSISYFTVIYAIQ